jgi:hypothetical protein
MSGLNAVKSVLQYEMCVFEYSNPAFRRIITRESFISYKRCATALAPAAVFALGVLSSAAPAQAWGEKGHRIVNSKRVIRCAARAALHIFYNTNRAYLVEHALEPDKWRRFDTSEAPVYLK